MKLSVADDLAQRGTCWEVWAYSRPHWQEKVNGDLCYTREMGAQMLVAVADVLGHGEGAHRGALALKQALQKAHGDLEQIYFSLEEAAVQTRGCALFLAMLHSSAIEYLLVGNVRTWVLTPETLQSLPMQSGIVGKRMLRPVVRRLELPQPTLLLVCTDGIKRSFSPTALQGTWHEFDEAVARRVVEQYGIPEDDASVLLGRRKK